MENLHNYNSATQERVQAILNRIAMFEDNTFLSSSQAAIFVATERKLIDGILNSNL